MEEHKAAISEPALAAQMEDNCKTFLRITEQYRRGFLTAEERDNRFRAQIYQGFDVFLQNRGLRFGVAEENWDRFLTDQELWRNGATPVPNPDCPWLLHDSEEASASDKAGVFRLMESLHCPLERFKPIPAACVRPGLRLDGYGTGLAGMIEFHMTDDGGLFREADPVGRTYTLTDARGLRAVLTITRIVTEQERFCDNRISALFSASGTVEGFTSSEDRSIKVSAPDREGRLFLYAVMKNEDLKVYYDYPLWSEYHALERARFDLAGKQLRKLVAQYDRIYGENAGRSVSDPA